MTRPWATVHETHTAVVFFVGDRAYKLKKPVDLGFLDFRTRAARLTACREEVRLNRRLAPDVYLGVADVVVDGRTVDHLVVMRRLPDDRRLAALVAVTSPDLDVALRDVARQLAALHADAYVAAGRDRAGSAEATLQMWRQELDHVEQMAQGVLSRRLLARVRTLAERYVEGRAELFEERRRRGRIREGHGDLLADDIFVLGDGPRVLDCLEFDQRLRFIDVWLDAAFLAMDLERLGAIDLAEAFLAAYGDAAGERPPASLLDLFVAYRAHVRAKVALVRRAQGEPGASGEARRLLALCCRHLEAATVSLTCVGGLPGSGKTTLSRALAARLDAELLSSDEIRAALLPPGGGEPDAWERGRYSPDATSTVYDEMLRRAGVALRLGVSVVLDATWRSPRQREAARRVARACGAVMTEIETVVPDEVAATWLADRTGSASQATVETRTSMVGVFAPWPQALRLDPRCGAPEAATERVRDDVVRSAGQPRRRTTSSAASRRG